MVLFDAMKIAGVFIPKLSFDDRFAILEFAISDSLFFYSIVLLKKEPRYSIIECRY